MKDEITQAEFISTVKNIAEIAKTQRESASTPQADAMVALDLIERMAKLMIAIIDGAKPTL